MSQDIRKWEDDPALYLFTSLTAGSSHIITATSRIDTILKANKIPYSFVDTATDESARKLWARRASGKKLPGLVKEGFVIADLEQIEEWNEFGEVKDAIGPLPAVSTASISAPAAALPASSSTPAKPTSSSTAAPGPQSQPPQQATLALRQASGEAAAKGAARQDTTSSTDVSKMRSQPGSAPKPAAETGPIGSNTQNEPAALSAMTSSDAASTSPPAPPPATRTHRGSSICEASVEEIRAIEEATAIKEEDEEGSSEGEEEEDKRQSDKAGSKLVGRAVSEDKGGKPQEQTAAKGDEAGESVED